MATGIERRAALTLDGSDRPLKELVADVGRDVRTLIRQEIALVKAEVRDKTARAAKGSVAVGAATILAHTGALALMAALVLGLVALGVIAWLAALLVAVVLLGGAALLLLRARRAFTGDGGLALRRTVAVARDTVRWMKEDML